MTKPLLSKKKTERTVPHLDKIVGMLEEGAADIWPHRMERHAASGVITTAEVAMQIIRAAEMGNTAALYECSKSLYALVEGVANQKKPDTDAGELFEVAFVIGMVLRAYARGQLDLRDALKVVQAGSGLAPDDMGRLRPPGARIRTALGVATDLALRITPKHAGESRSRSPSEIRLLVGFLVQRARGRGIDMEEFSRQLQVFGFVRRRLDPATLDEYERQFRHAAGQRRPRGRPPKKTG